MSDPSRVERVVQTALARRQPAERAAYLDGACGDDPEFRQQVELRLAALQASAFASEAAALEDGSDTELAAADLPSRAVAANQPELAPTLEQPPASGQEHSSRIGPYKLLQQLGEGGMGSVYLAEQDRPVKRRVALKVIKAGMDSARVIARFEQERQALALMDHPHIAKVLDAGTTDSGRPYFVMELVKGVAITDYCDRERLSVIQRLELFLPVCQAVQHAHQKGIIHRDLKPSNVIVALYDNRPVPKVIDFGVAKAMHQKLTERTMFTEVGSIVGTLEYMAPEQAELNNLDIDTRADIYSLGVLLYQLLTGSPPLNAAQLRSVGFAEMLRLIREVEPPKPSTKLLTSVDLPAIAARRTLEPRRLTSVVAGELDWIVMKALEKERNRRYETASALAFDIERFLANEPVLASPPSASYRLRKFCRRNKLVLAAATVVSVALLAGSMGTAWQAVLASQEARRAAEAERAAEENAARTRQVIERFLIQIGDDQWARVPGFEHLRVEMVEQAVHGYRQLLARKPDDPALRNDAALALRRAANLYRMMNRFEAALPLYDDSLKLQAALVAEFPERDAYLVRLVDCQLDQANALQRVRGPAAAIPGYRQAYETARQARTQSPHGVGPRLAEARAAVELGEVLAQEGQWNEGLSLAEAGAQTLSLYAEPPRSSGRVLAVFAWNTTSRIARDAQQFDAARNANRQTLTLARSLLADDPQDPNARFVLAAALLETSLLEGLLQSDDAELLRLLDEAAGLLRALSTEYGSTAANQRKLAEVLTQRGEVHLAGARLADAEADAESAVALLSALSRESYGASIYDEHLGAAGDLRGRIADAHGDHLAARRWWELALRRSAWALAASPADGELHDQLQQLEQRLATWPPDAPPPARVPFEPAQARQHQQAWADYLRVPVEYENSLGMKFVLLPPGEFTMGGSNAEIAAHLAAVSPDNAHLRNCIQSERPPRQVLLSQPIYIGTREVTQGQYAALMGKNPSYYAPNGEGQAAVSGLSNSSHPVESITWLAAAEFCQRLSEEEGLQPWYSHASGAVTMLDGTGYRLPTEAEWEFACRAGSPLGSGPDDSEQNLPRHGWFERNSDDRTHVVGELAANPLGLYDLRGNVWEWVQDWWSARSVDAPSRGQAINPDGPRTGDLRVVRGGGYHNPALSCRASHRYAFQPTGSFRGIGFRVVLVPAPTLPRPQTGNGT
ncbi:MAG: SUMF1/EgtB/PvdO family nonheme iron enzyme [Pirellulaceae bacterium]|nr:SUMF1/EgtB/PvdO family nonheme iron enzyme [Pirellulaceae bacterium]